MYSNIKNCENIYNRLRVIQQNKNEVEICQLLAADLLNTMKKQRPGLNKYNVLRDSWISLDCQTTQLEICSKRRLSVESRWTKQQTKFNDALNNGVQ